MTIRDGLEHMLGERRTERLTNHWLYRFGVDGIANNLFSLSYAINERFVAGMDWDDVGKTRLAAAIGNMITGRPYGMYRDWAMKKLAVDDESHWLKKYVADVGIFVTGQTPLYFLYMAPAGLDWRKMLAAGTFLTLIAPLAGRPQGWTYDYVRKQFGLESALDAKPAAVLPSTPA